MRWTFTRFGGSEGELDCSLLCRDDYGRLCDSADILAAAIEGFLIDLIDLEFEGYIWPWEAV